MQRGFLPIWAILLIVIGITTAAVISFPKSPKLVEISSHPPLPEEELGEVGVTVTPSATPDPFANWKIYRNEEFGFEFKYPTMDSEVNVVSKIDGIYFKYGLENSVDHLYTLRIINYENIDRDSLNDWFLHNFDKNDILKNSEMFNSEHISGGDLLKIGAIPNEYSEGPVFKIAYLMPESKKFTLGFDMSQDPGVKIQEYLDQILTTFKFIEPSPSTALGATSAAGWKTYRNEAYGFEIKLPPEFLEDHITQYGNHSSYFGTTVTTVRFVMDARNTLWTGDKFGAFVILIYSRDWWINSANGNYLKGQEQDLGNYLGEDLGENSQYVMTWTKGHDCPGSMTDKSNYGYNTVQCKWYENADQILATFKFIEPSPSTALVATSAAGWKTYRNEEYGFEFNYPTGWNINAFDPIQTKDSIYGSGNLLWINFRSKENERTYDLSIEILSKEDKSLYPNSKTRDIVSYGLAGNLTTAYLQTFEPESLYECYGVNSLRGSCSDRVSIMVTNGKYWYVISGLLVNKTITETYRNILSTFRFIEL